jgi:hypothetical protein
MPERRMWLYTRHDLTMEPWDARRLTPLDLSGRESIRTEFGVDLDKVERWRARRVPDLTSTASHPGLSAREQYDRMFRLAALNRQVEALRRTLSQTQELDARIDVDRLRSLLAEQSPRRDSLLQLLRAGGREEAESNR